MPRRYEPSREPRVGCGILRRLFAWLALANRTKRTPKRVQAILDALRGGDAIGTACARAGIGRSTFAEWRSADPVLDAQVDDAIEYGTDVLEDVARDRSIRHSDTLLIFLLKARRPDKYRETTRISGEVTHRWAEEVAAEVGVEPSEIQAEAERIAAAAWGKER